MEETGSNDFTEEEMREIDELEDIEAALERDTQDGPGAGEVPPADFVSFATDGVEKEN